jgi:hypothetical protein
MKTKRDIEGMVGGLVKYHGSHEEREGHVYVVTGHQPRLYSVEADGDTRLILAHPEEPEEIIMWNVRPSSVTTL